MAYNLRHEPTNRTLTTRELVAAFFYENPNPRELVLFEYQSSTLPKLPDSLEELTIIASPNLDLENWQAERLRTLRISECASFRRLPQEMPNLQHLYVNSAARFDFRKNKADGCSKPDNLPNLRQLHLYHCPLLTRIVCTSSLLEAIELRNCSHLTEIPLLPESLRSLTIAECPIGYLPVLPKQLNRLHVFKCKQLVNWIKVPPTLKWMMFEECPGIRVQIAEGDQTAEPASASKHVCGYLAHVQSTSLK